MLLGMDPEAVEAAGRSLVKYANDVTAVKNTVGRVVSESRGSWHGRDAEAFLATWRTSDSQLRQLASALEEYGRKLQQQAADQRRVSGDLASSGSAGHQAPSQPPARHNPYTRDEPATAAQIKDIDTRLKVIGQPNIKDHFPAAYAKAAAWGAELQANPQPSAAEVAAFEKYCYLLSVAHVNRGTVEDFATIAADNFTEGSKAGVGMISAAAGLMTPAPGYMTKFGHMDAVDAVASGITGYAGGTVDWAEGAARGMAVEVLTEQDVDGIVANYDRRADSYLAGLYDQAHASTSSSVVSGSAIMMMHVEEFDGRLATMRIESEKVGAFDFMTGTGAPVDSGLRGVLKTVPGVGHGISGAEVLGNLGKEAVAFDVCGHAYRQAALGGMDSLIRAAQTSGFQD